MINEGKKFNEKRKNKMKKRKIMMKIRLKGDLDGRRALQGKK